MCPRSGVHFSPPERGRKGAGGAAGGAVRRTFSNKAPLCCEIHNASRSCFVNRSTSSESPPDQASRLPSDGKCLSRGQRGDSATFAISSAVIATPRERHLP